MIECKKCGIKNPESAKFCRCCGSKLRYFPKMIWVIVPIVLVLLGGVMSVFIYNSINDNNTKSPNYDLTNQKEINEIEHSDTKIKYDQSLASTGWTALYDTHKNQRCYMTHDDYYSIKNSYGNLKDEYSYLIPLGMVIKYHGANIIWGFAGVESVNWKDAHDYVNSFSPDGQRWRLISKIEATAINTKHYDFSKHFESYYPNDLSYLGSYLSIETWTSEQSDEVWTRRSDGRNFNKVYTLDIYGDDSKIQHEYTTCESDRHNVYPISTL